MECRFSFKNLKRSEVLMDFAQPKVLSKIEKYTTKPIDAHVTFEKGGFEFIARCTLKGGDGFNAQVESTSDDIYTSLDMMLAKLEIQLKKQKEKIKNHKKHDEKETIRHLRLVMNESPSEDWDSAPVDAGDIIKYEKSRRLTG